MVGQALVYYIQYMKYIIVWWLGESVTISLGMSYNGMDQDQTLPKWDATCNFSFTRFVLGPFYQDIVTGLYILMGSIYFSSNRELWIERNDDRKYNFGLTLHM